MKQSNNNNDSLLRKKARKKYLSSAIAWSLVSLSPSTKTYWNATRCSEELFVDKDQQLYSAQYCRARFCPTCASIKMATMISKYLPVFSKLDDLHFVTLTLPTVTAEQIPDRLTLMQKSWTKIRNLAGKQLESFNGIRKTELKVSKGSTKLYHPHFHFIIQGKKQAYFLRDQWLRINPTASIKAQDIRCVTNNSDNKESALRELFKYSTKLTCSNDAGNEIAIPTYQLHIIIQALHGKRIFQSFGDIKQVNEDEMDIQKVDTANKAVGFYKWNGVDWVHKIYNQNLSDYKPDNDTLTIAISWKNTPYKIAKPPA